MEVHVSLEPSRERLVDGLHIGYGFWPGRFSRADRRNRVVVVRMAVLAVPHDQVRCRKSDGFPLCSLAVVEIENQPAHEPWAIDLHVRIADGIFPRPDAGGGLVVAAAGQI